MSDNDNADEDSVVPEMSKRGLLSSAGLAGATALGVSSIDAATAQETTEPRIQLGQDWVIDDRDSGDTLAIEHKPSGASLVYDSAAGQWVLGDDLAVNSNDVTGVGSLVSESIETEGAVIESEKSGVTDDNPPLEINRTGTYSQSGSLYITDSGSEVGTTGGDKNNIITRTTGSLQVVRNMVWDDPGDDWKLEKDGSGGILEVGKEGIQLFTKEDGQAGDFGLLEKFEVSTNKGGSIFWGSGESGKLLMVHHEQDKISVRQGDLYFNSADPASGMYDYQIQQVGNSSSDTGLLRGRYSNDDSGAQTAIVKSRSGAAGTPGTAVQDNDTIWLGRYFGDDGTDTKTEAARISVEVDGSVGGNTVPGRIKISTADASGSLSDAVTFDSSQNTTHHGGTIRDQRKDPTTSELDQGQTMTYNSDGSGTGSAGDLVYAINDSGTIKTDIIAQRSNAT